MSGAAGSLQLLQLGLVVRRHVVGDPELRERQTLQAVNEPARRPVCRAHVLRRRARGTYSPAQVTTAGTGYK